MVRDFISMSKTDNKEHHINFVELFLNVVDNYCLNELDTPSSFESDTNQIPDSPLSHIQTDKLNNEQSLNEENQIKLNEMIEQSNKLLQKQNQIKNLLKAFQKHVVSINEPEKKELYCELYSKARVSFFNLKKIITKRIKDKQTRWNMKLKSILKSKGIGILFNHFLKNESNEWLQSSKVENKQQLQQLINFLIYLQSHEDEFDIIKTYKK